MSYSCDAACTKAAKWNFQFRSQSPAHNFTEMNACHEHKEQIERSAKQSANGAVYTYEID